MDKFADRLRKIINGETVAAFSKRSGVTEGVLLHCLNKGGLPSIEKAGLLASNCDVSLDWLVNGKGDMYGNTADSEFVMIPRLDIEASAGHGRFNMETVEIIDYIPFTLEFFQRRLKRAAKPYPQHLKIITIKGDSMLPTMDDNDLAMIDLADKTRTDGIYAFVDDDGVKVKRLRFTPQKIEVISDNKEIYPPYEYKKSDLEQYYFEILGPIKWLGRSLIK